MSDALPQITHATRTQEGALLTLNTGDVLGVPRTAPIVLSGVVPYVLALLGQGEGVRVLAVPDHLAPDLARVLDFPDA